jgi:hypothetical protein
MKKLTNVDDFWEIFGKLFYFIISSWIASYVWVFGIIKELLKYA